ncbi:MAG: hypothetical protein LBI90_09460 [Treponema sp.]|jgi:hypothetical protein|nr:hypothetical protein [Treponema sp.]
MAISLRVFACASLLFCGLLSVSAQNADSGPENLVGLDLTELFSRFGVPKEVYSARGAQEWQDDVVFVYPEGDFYLYRDRVWQVGVKNFREIRIGDSRPAAILSLGEGVREFSDSVICSLRQSPWPLDVRLNFNSAGAVSAIFLYRPDL